MTEIYLFFLIIGGGLLTFSLLGGHDSDSSAHADTHIGIDTDHHIDVHSADTAHSGEVSPTNTHSSITDYHNQSSLSDNVKFLSIRNLTYFMAFFGLTGTILTLISTAILWTFAAALSAGGFAAWYGYKLMKYLKTSETGQAINIKDLSGKKAIVTLPIKSGNKGKVQVYINGQTEEIPAVLAENAAKKEFNYREEVLITEVNNGIAYISEYDL